MLASSQLNPQPISTINGKLVVAAPKESDCLNIQMKDFAQKLEQIQFSEQNASKNIWNKDMATLYLIEQGTAVYNTIFLKM
jgi:hypothetical protein